MLLLRKTETGGRKERRKMTRDVLLFGMTQTQKYEDLMVWKERTTELHDFVPDFHRLQLEYWIWSQAALLRGKQIIDVGVQNPRRWLGEGYKTMGLYGCDMTGDLRNMADVGTESLDAMIVTEVLEHCEQPFQAAAEIHRVLKPGSIALVTSPFIWPWHGTHEYHDYWRFTHEGWGLLFKAFGDVKIKDCKWTDEGKDLYDLIRRFECMGHDSFTHATTGYLVTATK